MHGRILSTTTAAFVTAIGTSAIAQAPPAPGDLIVTEIMANPNPPVQDEYGEWFEILNISDHPIELAGLEFSDDDFDVFVIPPSPSIPLAPGEYFVLGKAAETIVNGGVIVSFEYGMLGSPFTLSNTADEIRISSGGVVIDWTAYTSAPPAGLSLTLDSDNDNAVSNDNIAAWCAASTPYGDGTQGGTPGQPNTTCGIGPVPPPSPEPGDLIVTEIMDQPQAVGPVGQWFEIHNPSNAFIELAGVRFYANGAAFEIPSFPSVPIGSGEYFVLGNNGNALVNGGVTLDFEYGPSFVLGSFDTLGMDRNSGAISVDVVQYPFVYMPGASRSLDPNAFDAISNDDPASWCTAVTPYGDGDLGTPGIPNDACLDSDGDGIWDDIDNCPNDANSDQLDCDLDGVGDICEIDADMNGIPDDCETGWIINEVMFDPPAGTDQFIEIVNDTGFTQDISGWAVRETNGAAHTFPNGTVVHDRHAVVVFENAVPDWWFGGAIVQTDGGPLRFNLDGETISLADDDGVTMVALTYDALPAGSPSQAITRSPDITGPFTLHQDTVTGGPYSPGSMTDYNPFPGFQTRWVINEVLAEAGGDVNNDGVFGNPSDEQFIEIVNNTGSTQDISGWGLAVGNSVLNQTGRHVFPSGTVLGDKCAIVVFGGGSPIGSFGGAIVQTASLGTLSIQLDYWVTLFDGQDTVASARFATPNMPVGSQSLVRYPDITGLEPLVRHFVDTGAGVPNSPGTMIDGTPFPGSLPDPTDDTIVAEFVDSAVEGWDALGYDAGAYDTFRVYAVFDEPVSVIGVGDAYADGTLFGVSLSNGLFHNDDVMGTDLPPRGDLLSSFPSLRWDTFVTIGELAGLGGGGAPMTTISPDFTPQAAGLDDSFTLDGTGWYVADFPTHANTVANRMLIAQFTVNHGEQVTGTNWRISYNVGGEGGTTYDMFGDFVTPDPCPADFNGNDFVRFEDITQLLGRWGACVGCIEDVDGDGDVGFADLTALLSAWGACP